MGALYACMDQLELVLTLSRLADASLPHPIPTPSSPSALHLTIPSPSSAVDPTITARFHRIRLPPPTSYASNRRVPLPSLSTLKTPRPPRLSAPTRLVGSWTTVDPYASSATLADSHVEWSGIRPRSHASPLHAHLRRRYQPFDCGGPRRLPLSHSPTRDVR